MRQQQRKLHNYHVVTWKQHLINGYFKSIQNWEDCSIQFVKTHKYINEPWDIPGTEEYKEMDLLGTEELKERDV